MPIKSIYSSSLLIQKIIGYFIENNESLQLLIFPPNHVLVPSNFKLAHLLLLESCRALWFFVVAKHETPFGSDGLKKYV